MADWWEDYLRSSSLRGGALSFAVDQSVLSRSAPSRLSGTVGKWMSKSVRGHTLPLLPNDQCRISATTVTLCRGTRAGLSWTFPASCAGGALQLRSRGASRYRNLFLPEGLTREPAVLEACCLSRELQPVPELQCWYAAATVLTETVRVMQHSLFRLISNCQRWSLTSVPADSVSMYYLPLYYNNPTFAA